MAEVLMGEALHRSVDLAAEPIIVAVQEVAHAIDLFPTEESSPVTVADRSVLVSPRLPFGGNVVELVRSDGGAAAVSRPLRQSQAALHADGNLFAALALLVALGVTGIAGLAFLSQGPTLTPSHRTRTVQPSVEWAHGQTVPK